MSDAKLATWWSPEGWAQYANPAAWDDFRKLMESDDAIDWYKALEKVGYDIIDREENFEHSDIKLNVGIFYDHPRHAFVEINNCERRLSLFFVEDGHLDVFFATKYLDLRKDIAAIDVGDIQRDMRRYQLAFIRYGHGKDTVDGDGWQTRDERIEAQRRAVQRQQEREAQKQAPAAEH